MDPYKVLGVTPQTSDDDVKRAYRELARKYHPDNYVNNPLADLAETRMKEINEAYDMIMNERRNPAGGSSGQQQSYGGFYSGGYQQGYSQQDGDWDFGFDPFGFGFGFGGYQQQSGASYSGSDTPEMQAARNFVANGRYAEARRVLDSMNSRSARWYYLSSVANQGLGNSIDALQDARRAVQLDPNNTEYQMHLRRMQNPGQTYRTQTTYAQPGGLMRWCWSMILLNLLCNCCCGGGWGWRFRM